MVGEVYYSLYELVATQPLNAVSKRVKREGALLKVSFNSGKMGYADCHAWPELGDLPIQEQLTKLAQGVKTPLICCALDFARLDAESRSNRKRILTSFPQYPQSHFLVSNLFSLTSNQVSAFVREGYTHVKIKVGRDIDREIERLHDLFVNTALKLRLDFNETASPEQFGSFLSRMDSLKKQIDFIEDPFPYSYQDWKEVQSDGWTLACDREAGAAAGSPEAAQILIVKPAINSTSEWQEWKEQKRIVTSYLGHPLGQVAAAYVAQEVDPSCTFVHGLLSHHVYEPNAFSRQLNWQGPSFIPPLGEGCGFDSDLGALQWTLLKRER